MVLNLLVLLVGTIGGFVGSRALRRPERAAAAASVARSLGGTLRARHGLSGPELQRACFSEMVRHVRVTRDGDTHAPTSYGLSLHPDDLAVIDEARRWFTDGLVDALRQAARDNDWRLRGPIEIDYRPDPNRRAGVPSAIAVVPGQTPSTGKAVAAPAASSAGGTGAPVRPSGRQTLSVVRADTGERVRLGPEAVTIGRSRDRTITIDDDRVSRSHARIAPRKGQWALTDEGSANGTQVAGETLPTGRPCPLRAGDVITVGPVELRVEANATEPPGTRALDDQDRTRISREVLPPGRDQP